MKKNILILQNEILHYRKALYNELSYHYNITVLHSGKQSVCDGDLYSEIITKSYKVGGVYIQKDVLEEVKSGTYDVVISMFDLRWINNIIAIKYRRKIKFLWWGHRYGKKKILNKIRDYFMKLSAGTILYNDSQVDTLLKSGIERSKIFIAENTIHVDNHEDLTDCNKSSFLYVGRAQKRKKLDVLIKVFSNIVNKIPKNISIDIVGEGEENSYLKELGEKLNISERINFYGKINDSVQLKEIYRKALAYVSPDAVGLGVQHSFSYGVPIVTSSVGFKGAEYDNLVNYGNSLLFEKEEEFKQILLKLIEDDKLRKKLGINAYELYKNKLSIKNMTKGFIDAIEGN